MFNFLAHTPRGNKLYNVKRNFLSLMVGAVMVFTHISGSLIYAQDLKIESDVTFQGRNCFKITTPWSTLYFENDSGSSGFKGVFCPEGKDWISANYGFGYSIKGGHSSEWRGFPNATDGNFGHPSRSSNSTNTITKQEKDHIIINSKNETMEFNYHFFLSHGAIEVIKAGEKYCFLWEGTNGGSCEQADFVCFSDGVKRYMTKTNYHDDIPDEWLYFGDPNLKNVFLMGMCPDDKLYDENWRDVKNYEVYSFGRGHGSSSPPWGPRTLTGSQNYLVYTFVERTNSQKEIKTLMNGLLAKPYESYGTVR